MNNISQEGGAMAHRVRKTKNSCSLLGVGRGAMAMNVAVTDNACGAVKRARMDSTYITVPRRVVLAPFEEHLVPTLARSTL